jgi:hypothetical protein
MMCALVFYFVYGSHASFKFEFESKELEFIKESVKWKAFPIDRGPKPGR